MRVVVLFSGGIDSPVAALLAAREGYEAVLLHMDNRPFTDDATEEKIPLLRDRIAKASGKEATLFTAPFGATVMNAIKNLRDRHLKCVHCKRSMLRVACIVASEEGAEAVITGESLGQVASQTLSNIRVEETASDLPIMRPLIGLDKEEIMRIAKDFRTFEISTSHQFPCGLVPDGPCVNASLRRVEEDETGGPLADAITECARLRKRM